MFSTGLGLISASSKPCALRDEENGFSNGKLGCCTRKKLKGFWGRKGNRCSLEKEKERN